MKCVPCLSEQPQFCMGGDCESSSDTSISKSDSTTVSEPEEDYESRFTKVRKHKRTASLKDPQSTGRKQAARLYPFLKKDGSVWVKGDAIEDRAICEWAFKEKAGGGKLPIRGCGVLDSTKAGIMLNRHHGPDKSTLNNEPDNVSLICAHCHNRWHSANDENYDYNNRDED